MDAASPDILTMFKGRRRGREVSQGSVSYYTGKSLPEASRRHALTSHWPEPGHLSTYKPITGKGGWFTSITVVLLGLGPEHLSLEHTAICSVLEQSGSSLGQEEGRTAVCLLQVLASAFTCVCVCVQGMSFTI